MRGYQLWSRLDGESLKIALRVELFSQAPGGSDLAKLGQRKFAELAGRYDVGSAVKVSGGDVRAVELTADFVA